MMLNKIRAGFTVVVLGLAAQGVAGAAAHADEFSFTATNTTKSVITGILVSENNSDWGHFDIGSGIEPGATSNLVWDQSTNGESCEQWVKATFADDTESEPAKFDFCENGLKLDF
jgi:hypothetical protein